MGRRRTLWVSVIVLVALVGAACSSGDSDDDASGKPDASTADIEAALAETGELSDNQIEEIAAATGPTCSPVEVQQVAAEEAAAAEAAKKAEEPAYAQVPDSATPPESPPGSPGGVVVVSESETSSGGGTTTTAASGATTAPPTTGQAGGGTTTVPSTTAPSVTTAPASGSDQLTAPPGCEIPVYAPNAGVPEADLSQVEVAAEGGAATTTTERASRSARVGRSDVIRSAAAARSYVVVMGDSYSSGEGTAYGTSNVRYERGACHNTWANYGGYTGAAYSNIACSGAVYANVMTKSQHGYAPQIQQLKYLNKTYGTPDVVMFSIGGNDLNFGAAVRNCVLAKWSPVDRNTYRVRCNNLLNNAVSSSSRAAHQNRVSNVIRAIKATAPGTNVMVVGYPALFAKSPSGYTCGVFTSTAARIRSVTRQVNAAAHKAATANGAVYVSPTLRYGGHHLCDGNGDNDWFVPVKARDPEAAHPRWNGHKVTGDLIRECWADWARCRGRGYIRSARFLKADGGAGDLADLEDDQEQDAPMPATPAAPQVKKQGSSVVVTVAAVANARTYEVFQQTTDGNIAIADTDAPGNVTVEPLPATPQCFGVVAVADDEAATASPVTCLGAASGTGGSGGGGGSSGGAGTTAKPAAPPTTAANRAPIALSKLIGMCKASAQTRYLTNLASDPDGRVARYELVSTSFGRDTYKFSWTGGGAFTMTIPRNNTASTTLTIRWRSVDNKGAKSAVANLDIRPVSC